MFSRAVDAQRVGEQERERWSLGAELMARAATRHGALTLSQRDIVQHPLETVQHIYRTYHLDLGLEAQRRMERFVLAHPNGDYGRNRYDARDYGYVGPVMGERFAAHNARMAELIQPLAAAV